MEELNFYKSTSNAAAKFTYICLFEVLGKSKENKNQSKETVSSLCVYVCMCVLLSTRVSNRGFSSLTTLFRPIIST